LSLQPQHGSADLNATFYGSRRVGDAAIDGGEEGGAAGGLNGNGSSSSIGGVKSARKHIIQVSTYHMVILMLFNHRDTWTYEVHILAYFVIRSISTFKSRYHESVCGT